MHYARFRIEQHPSKGVRQRIGKFREVIREWYLTNKRQFPWRKNNLGIYGVTISEVLLQRTQAETVREFYPRFIKRYQSWKKIAIDSKRNLKKFIKPIGLSDQKSLLLHALAKEISGHRKFSKATREQLEALPGVGQYVASAILCICQGMREPLLDVNMARVLERFFGPRKLADIRYDPYLQNLARSVLPRKSVKEFNWAILDFAALVCRARVPKCSECVLSKECLYRRAHYPMRANAK